MVGIISSDLMPTNSKKAFVSKEIEFGYGEDFVHYSEPRNSFRIQMISFG